MDDIEAYSDSIATRERDHIFENVGGGRFRELGARAGPFFRITDVGRGLATLDFDRDGRMDVALTRNGGRARLLHNDSPVANHWLSIRLRGTRSNRSGIGARIIITAGDRTQAAELQGGSSYESASEQMVHFGLGLHSGPVSLEVRWPSGLTEKFPAVPPDQFLTVQEGTGTSPSR
jgi:hypothetical protein